MLFPLKFGTWLRVNGGRTFALAMSLATLTSVAVADESDLVTLTNLQSLKNTLTTEQRVTCALDLTATVCAADRATSLLLLQDASGVEVLAVELNGRVLSAGERVHIKIARCELIRRKWCVAVGVAPVVGNIGFDVDTERFGRINLASGLNPLRLFYFNAKDPATLEVNYSGPEIPLQPIPSDAFYLEPHKGAASSSNRAQGLKYYCYQDSPFSLDDAQRMQPVDSGVTTNFNIELRQPREFVAMQFRGLLQIPRSGEYMFSIRADDGCSLYVGSLRAEVTVVASIAPPTPNLMGRRQASSSRDEWAMVEGRVTFAGEGPDGLELELTDGIRSRRVWLADRSGISLPLPLMANARVRATGICQSMTDLDERRSEQVAVVNAANLQVVDISAEQWTKHPLTTISNVLDVDRKLKMAIAHLRGTVTGLQEGAGFVLADGSGTIPVRLSSVAGLTNGLTVEVLAGVSRADHGVEIFPAFCRPLEMNSAMLRELTTAAQVQQLSTGEAAKQYPVRVRGVVTCIVEWGGGVVQDATRGVFVNLNPPAYLAGIVPGDYVEARGVSAVGDFAPTIDIHSIERLGRAPLPEPVIPNWKQLMSGSLDSQYAEVRGIITAVERNQATLLTDNGKIRISVRDTGEAGLGKYLNTLVRIRGCLLAVWDAQTRQVKIGEIVFRNPIIEVDQLPMVEPFSAPAKTIPDLLLFDLRASGFQRVKVSGQIVHVRGRECFLMQAGHGLRFQSADGPGLKAGELVDVVGLPDLSGPSPRLHEALVRKTGVAELPAPLAWSEAEKSGHHLDAIRVQMNARLIGIHHIGSEWVLELQTGLRAYRALVNASENLSERLPLNSLLQLSGTYAILDGEPNDLHSAFEVLLNSAADIRLIARPPWWNLRRLLIIVAALLTVLLAAAVWIKLLRRQVEQRTVLLEREHARRERAERERALEFERARIARDLHDDLGSSLSEIRVMASTGQRLKNADTKAPSIFQGITETAQSLIAALDVIVWAVDPEANSLESLADYLSGYATEYLAKSNIACRFKIPMSLPAVPLDGRVRHDLFLAVKETLHNVVRHSGAAHVEFRLTTGADAMTIEISDDGCGFDLGSARMNGHGLKNIAERVAHGGGNCTIESQPGSGTTVRIQLPLPEGGSESGTG